MIPFNIQDVRAGHPIETRDKRRATYLTDIITVDSIPVVIVLIDSYVYYASIIGRINTDGADSPNDLFMSNTGRKIWVNVYDTPRTPSGLTLGEIFEDEEAALIQANRASAHLATVALQF